MIFEIKVDADVLKKSGIRRRTVDGTTHVFGAEPLRLEFDELPAVLAEDPHLRIKAVASPDHPREDDPAVKPAKPRKPA
jgi:hypothetical protein